MAAWNPVRLSARSVAPQHQLKQRIPLLYFDDFLHRNIKFFALHPKVLESGY
jgi:hypothetical protein